MPVLLLLITILTPVSWAEPAYKAEGISPAVLASDAQVVMIGERHMDRAPKQFLKDNLAEFQRLGFTHLGMEMFNTNQQEELDLRLRPRKDILQDSWHWQLDNYLPVLDEADRLGVPLVALDGRHTLADPDSQSMEHFAEDTQYRDNYMAKSVAAFLRNNPKAKLLVWTGGLHNSYFPDEIVPASNRSLRRILEEDYAIQVKTYIVDQLIPDTKYKRFLGEGKKPHPISKYYRAAYLRDGGAAPTRALLATPVQESGYDGIILWD